jgi:hypothetical protein
MIFQLDMVKFLSNFGNGKFLKNEGSRYGIFPTGSGVFLRENDRHCREQSAFSAESCGIRWRESSTWENLENLKILL